VRLVLKFAGGWLAGRMIPGAGGLASPATLPVVALVLFVCSLAAMPVECAMSRAFERQADRTALELTGDGRTFVEMQVKLARSNASDPAPPALFYYMFYTHPSTMERIAAGEEYGG
jgi:STE24 endopeptidase